MHKLFLKRVGSALCGLLFVCFAVTAQIDTTSYHKLEGIEVTGKARPSTARSSAPIQIATRNNIERLGLEDVSEAVKRFSGVTVQDYGGVGGLKTVSVRSLGAKHTAVNYDGISITDAQSGQVDISRFSLDNVDMISIAIGQSDDIFQPARSYASAGVLNIQTKTPLFDQKNTHIQARIKGGSFGMVTPSLRIEQKISNQWYITADGDYYRADGRYSYLLENGSLTEKKKRRNSDIESWHTELNINGKLGNHQSLLMKGYYFDSHRGLPGSIILYTDDNRERLWDRNAFFQARYENRVNERLTFRVDGKYNYSWMRHLDIDNKYENGEQDDRYTQNEYYTSVSGLYRWNDAWSMSLSEDFIVNTLDNTIPECPFPKRYSSLSALGVQYSNSRLTATGSLLYTYMTEHVESGDKPADRNRLSPALGASWRPFEDSNFRVRLSYKDIFRVPTFNDLYYLRIGNTGLKPEKATQYNIGTTWNGSLGAVSYLNLTLDGYYNRIKDKIVAIPNMFIWRMMNLGTVSIGGIDANAEAQLPLINKILLIGQLSYSYQHAIDITDESDKNYRDQIPYTPRHTGNFSLSVENPWVNMSYYINMVGERYSNPQNIERNRIDGYVEQSISFNKTLDIRKSKIRLQLEVLNLGNINYEIIKYYPMSGRSFRASILYKW